MTKQDEYAEKLKGLADLLEKNVNQQNSSFINANFESEQHIMLIEEKILKDYKKQVVNEEYSLLEKVDLMDMWSLRENNGHKTW